MAKKNIKPDKKGMQKLMKGSEMTSSMRNIAGKMTGGSSRYQIQSWQDARASRTVVNIRDLNRDAVSHEIATGALANMAVRRV